MATQAAALMKLCTETNKSAAFVVYFHPKWKQEWKRNFKIRSFLWFLIYNLLLNLLPLRDLENCTFPSLISVISHLCQVDEHVCV